MPDRAKTRIYYEQPLNERIRAFLRLEHLFERAAQQLERRDIFGSRGTLDAIIDVMAVVSRADLKKELIKEIERHAGTLEGLERDPRVDHGRLESVLVEVRTLLTTLKSSENALGHELRNHELLNSVRQRSSIPAGTCDFDLPAYHFWLERPVERREQDLRSWLDAFGLLKDSVALCLRLLRESTVATNEVAPAGFFQRSLETQTPCQMIRVALPADSDWYPEISAGRHRFTVRFMEHPDPSNRPAQTNEDVGFELLICTM